jgi:hypothetical protein
MRGRGARAGRPRPANGLERDPSAGETGPDAAEARVAANPERVAEGWTPRFVADPARTREAVELYRELGFEVLAEPIAPEDLGGDCEDCRLVMQLRFRMIYTRQPAPKPAAG